MMGIRDEVRDKIARWLGSSSPIGSAKGGATALNQLRELLDDEGIVESLARFDGQSVRQLEETFELLPLGTRMALEQVGALRMVDKGNAMLAVVVEPFAVDLVHAAALAADREADEESTELLRAELRRLRRHWYTLQEMGPNDRPTALATFDDLDVVGSIHTKAAAAETDDGGETLVFDLLDDHGQAVSAGIRVHCERSRITTPITVGTKVDLDFVVAVPKRMRFAKASAMLSSYPVAYKEVRDSVLRQPGLMFAGYLGDGTGRATLIEVESEEEASGVGYLWAVNGQTVVDA